MASVAELTQWYWEWQEGRSKNDIELVELNDPASHGKMEFKDWPKFDDA